MQLHCLTQMFDLCFSSFGGGGGGGGGGGRGNGRGVVGIHT